ncbi:diguanylate cyclase (GGDEF)-like protein [Celerinatantimonas diazotrophica]|uniref:diguanylate cyclase n=2 Tax=Celerinatantimonas diazotrophica TaxID=412034 RepID=A0A4V2PNJ4_9GAMM|nr:diguanylate cyclase (GGDEF)-like protein [Celerinatantimonas diazotrophica]CAG9296074.1 hypothetical protein CEDIAZO_01213 [Celerinatantimonas diazotrophica]
MAEKVQATFQSDNQHCWNMRPPLTWRPPNNLSADKQLRIIEHLQKSQNLSELFDQFTQVLTTFVKLNSITFINVHNQLHVNISHTNSDCYAHEIQLSDNASGKILFYSSHPWQLSEISLLKRFCRLFQVILPQIEHIDRLQYQLNHDYLTGIKNRQNFDENLSQMIAQNSRIKTGLQLLLCDVNNFKQINDQHGHLAGDQVLQFIAKTLLQACRKTDHVSRYGGDEFAIILCPAQPRSALNVIERVNNQLPLQAIVPNMELSISSGWADWHPGMQVRDLIEAADQAMYRHKIAKPVATLAAQGQ